MTDPSTPHATAMPAGTPSVSVVLYVAGRSPNSESARRNLTQVLGGMAKDSIRVEVVDVAHDPGAALRAGVIITPSLVRVSPEPRRTLIGDLRESARLVALLQPGEG